MLHVVPIICIVLFIGLVEYRLKQHLDNIERRLTKFERELFKREHTNA